jgi:hypothetical protein
LEDPTSDVHTSSVEEIYEDPDFQKYDFTRFKANFKNLKDGIAAKNAAVQFDQQSFDSEKELFPRNPSTVRGHLFWNGSYAEAMLAEDIKANRINHMTPKLARAERPDYEAFPLEVFRNHFYKEISKQRQEVYWQVKRNRHGRKQHEKEEQQLKQIK